MLEIEEKLKSLLRRVKKESEKVSLKLNIKNTHTHKNRLWASLVAQMIKSLPAMQETWVQSLDQEDPLEKREWQPTPVFLPGESHGQRSPVGCSPWGRKESDTIEHAHKANLRKCSLFSRILVYSIFLVVLVGALACSDLL